MNDRAGMTGAEGQPALAGPGEEPVRDRLLRTALRRFATEGYHAVSLREIVEACELTKGAVYWYFESKEDLFRAAVTEHLASFQDRLMSETGEASTWEEQLARAFRLFIAVLDDRDDPHRDVLFLLTLRGAGGPGQDELGLAALQGFGEWIGEVLATHPDQERRAEFAALVHATGYGVLCQAAMGVNVARPALATLLDLLGGGPLNPQPERKDHAHPTTRPAR